MHYGLFPNTTIDVSIIRRIKYPPTLVSRRKGKPVAKRHYMVSGTLAPLYTVFGLKLGCNRAAAPIGDKVL